MRADPVRQRLALGRLHVCVVAGAEHTDEDLRLSDLARCCVNDRHCLTRVVDEAIFSGLTEAIDTRGHWELPLPMMPAKLRYCTPSNCRNMRTFILTALLALCAVNGGLNAQVTSAAVLQAGDAVKITVWEHEELSGQFDITADGMIAHPLYRSIRAAGVPQDELEPRIAELLRQFDTMPQFVVQPLFRVVVGGEVRQPSLYLLSPETTISQAVGLAGGVTDRAHLEKVVLFRGGEETVIDLSRAEVGTGQMPVRSGDQIFVPRRISFFRDYIAPAGSITGAVVAIISLLIRN